MKVVLGFVAACLVCPEYSFGACRHEAIGRRETDGNLIPDWCPLQDADDPVDWKSLARELAEALETARDYMFIEEATPLDSIREDKDRRMVDDLLARAAGLLEVK